MKNRRQNQADELCPAARRREVFLVVSGPDLEWLETEARRSETERLGYEPDRIKLQPVIYRLIRQARIAATA